MKRRLLSVLLALTAMSLTVWLTIPVFAADSDFEIENGVLKKYNGTEESVTVPDSVTKIERQAFSGCSSLKSVTIGDGVTSVLSSSFDGCNSLTNISVNENNKNFSSIDGVLFNKNKTALICCPDGYTGNYTIPGSVTSIRNYAFDGCTRLTNVTIGNNVTSIGYHVFAGCSSLLSVTIPNSVTTIGNSTFYKCISLASVTIPRNVTNIAEATFNGCSNLTSVTIPNGVTSIGSGAFGNCSSLTSISIPNSVTSIGSGAFGNCSSLISMSIPDSVKQIGSDAFRDCDRLTNVTIGSNVTSIEESAFNGCSNLTSVTIGNSVTSIGDWAFYGCNNLTGIVIPNSVTSIGSNSFSCCSSLTSVTIGNSVTSIGESAFLYCGLKSVTIPNSVTSIGNYTFRGCSSLTIVMIGNSVTSIGDWAFYGCNNLTGVVIPNSVTSIGNNAFSDCSSLKSVTISNNMTSVASDVFSGCRNLISVTIPDSVTSIADRAFFCCNSLTDVYYGGTKAQWDELVIGDANDSLTHAVIHFPHAGYSPSGDSSRPTISYKTASKTTKPKADTVSFDSGVRGGRFLGNSTYPQIDTGWSFDWFASCASTYNHKLAISALVLSANEYNSTLRNQTLRTFGFTNIFTRSADVLFDMNQIGFTIASSLQNINGEQTNVIAVVCRGSSNLTDWASNLLAQANGFRSAAERVQEYLDDYIADNGIDIGIPTKILITGHSRGAAVANILATIVSHITADENVYAYTFACPNTTTDWRRSNYRNIFNFSNSADPVPSVPPMLFGNNKFGHCYNYDNFESNTRFASAFYEVTGEYSVVEAYLLAETTMYSAFHLIGHTPAVYMACLLSDKTENGFSVSGSSYKSRVISVKCPVDVAVYDAQNHYLGSVVDNVPDSELLANGVFVVIDGDEKYLYTAGGLELRLELSGTDTGSMTYSVEEIDTSTGEVTNSQIFSNVALAEGKTMVSSTAGDTQLLVTENGAVSAMVDESGGETDAVLLSFVTGMADPIRDLAVSKGETVSELPEPKLDGYAFAGWYTDEEQTTPFDASAPVSEPLTLFAAYEEDYPLYGRFTELSYDGETLEAEVGFDYNRCPSRLIVALYSDGQMIGIDSMEIDTGMKSAAIRITAPDLYGFYTVKAFFLSDGEYLCPINPSVEATFFAN